MLVLFVKDMGLGRKTTLSLKLKDMSKITIALWLNAVTSYLQIVIIQQNFFLNNVGIIF